MTAARVVPLADLVLGDIVTATLDTVVHACDVLRSIAKGDVPNGDVHAEAAGSQQLARDRLPAERGLEDESPSLLDRAVQQGDHGPPRAGVGFRHLKPTVKDETLRNVIGIEVRTRNVLKRITDDAALTATVRARYDINASRHYQRRDGRWKWSAR